MYSFSALWRNDILQAMVSTTHDLLIIGGGITGVGIALDAASRGLKVALVEKTDFGYGTSSRSTKLVHGGLRYLKQFEIGLVRQVGHERELLHQNAAHLVIPEKMLLPIIKNGSLGKYSTRLGLTVYDFLAGVKKEEKHRMLNKKQVLNREPMLHRDLVLGGAIYYEYKTSDSRLTIEIAKKANQHGALMLNYCKAEDFIYENNQITGVKIRDENTGRHHVLLSRYVVNAAGPWVDQIRKKNHSLHGKKLHLTKGVHLVVSLERLPVKHACYFDVEDGRMIFVIPRNSKVYIGTTDTNYYDEIDHPRVTKNDAAYLLNAVNRLFPDSKLRPEHVETSWAGLRPLIHKEGKTPSELSRKDEIFISNSGLISIAGGKLTGYRTMSKKVVDLVMKKLHEKHHYKKISCKTKTIKLAGGEFDFEPSALRLTEFIEASFDEAKQTGIQYKEFEVLAKRYGTNIAQLTEKAFGYYNESKNTQQAWLKAEISYGIEHEMVQSPEDFFIRRTEMLYFEKDRCLSILDDAVSIFKDFFKWSAQKQKEEVEKFMHKLTFIV